MRIGIALIAIVIGACGSSQEPPLVATDVVVTRPVAGMGMSAAYLSLSNNSQRTITISRVASPQFGSVELHETTVENGVARMRALAALDIPGGATVRLERGGKHLMLMRPAAAGDTVSLQFFDNDDLILALEASFEPPGD